MPTPIRAVLGLTALVLVAAPTRTAAQSIELGGLAFVDYFYTVASPEEDRKGFHGFTYRRIYLTTDFSLSDDFSGRVRLEANEDSEGPRGPEAFVKDLWVSWRYWGRHEVMLGVMPPPAFEIAEGVWRFRSLEQTILDFQNVNTSRDFGLRFSGPLGSGFSYSAMVANNNGVSSEDDNYKRAYGQLAYHLTENLVFSIGADRAGYSAPRESGTRVSGFGGYSSEEFNIGLEVYWHELTFEVADEFQGVGASLFSSVRVTPAWELVGRIDAVAEKVGDADVNERFFLVGAAYRLHDNVRIIPNLWVFDTDQIDEPEALARMTVEVRF